MTKAHHSGETPALSRRTFLKTEMSVIIAPIALLKAGAALVARRGLIRQLPVAAFQYHKVKWLWLRLCEGQGLTLMREPKIAHDANAVGIAWRGRKLGVAPRHLNTASAWLLDERYPLDASISRLRDSANI